MFRGPMSFMDRIRYFFSQATEGIRELGILGQSYVLIIFRKNGQLIYRMNAGMGVLVLVIINLLFPALVVFGLFIAFILGLRGRFQRVY